MKLGIHACSFISNFSDDYTKDFEFLKNSGLSVVEVSILNDYSEERAQNLLAASNKYGIELTCCTALPEGSDISSSDENERNRAILYLKNCIDFSKKINSKTISGLLYTVWGKIDNLTPKKQKWLNSLDSMREVADYAEKANITLALEVVNRFESDYFNTIAEAKEYIDLVNKGNVKLLIDTFHMNIEEKDFSKAIVKYGEYIVNVHICENDRSFPGNGNFDFKSLFKSLKEIEYDKNVIMECAVINNSEIGNAFYIWRNLLKKDIYSDIKESIKFIKKGFIKH